MSVALLERAVSYTLGSLVLAEPAAMGNRTPCAQWDLRALLAHMDDSLLALAEAADLGHIDLPGGDDLPGDGVLGDGRLDDGLLGGGLRGDGRLGGVGSRLGGSGGDPVARLRWRACRLIGAWSQSARCPMPVGVGEAWLAREVVAGVGALEVAVHGWDVARACGGDRPLPDRLARELLELAVVFVADDDRPHRFHPPVRPASPATSSDRLLGFLGRSP
ncbi:TIGR03086 family protein [Nonomuraea typhae]|uniref:TIGR03086 family protein n=1 Tax=Nonomuraea typhae TaxID=2603600 RepID=UPI0012FA1F9E|nr:TIGR03086 family protein [Nonomuraea typhae]